MDHDATSAAAVTPIPGGGGAGNIPVVDKGADFANYFCTYGFLYHQKEMLSDRVRMDAYYNAVFDNAADHFRGKVCISSPMLLLSRCLCARFLLRLADRS